MPSASPSDNINFASILAPDDTVFVAQGAGEPTVLARRLVEQSETLPRVRVLLGMSLSSIFTPQLIERFDLSVTGGIASSRALATADKVDVLPVQISRLPGLFASRRLPVDVALIQVSPADSGGWHSLGATADLVLAAVQGARVVVAEVNDQVPWTEGGMRISSDQFTHELHVSEPLPELVGASASELDRTIARYVAGVIEDRAVLQMGIGKIPDAIMSELREHRDLGIHTGMLGDSLMELIDAGVVTNAYKPIDTGTSVTGVLMGSHNLYRWADRNPAIAMRPADYTHSAQTLSKLPTFTSVNSALEVDLTGQVNAETIDGLYVGSVGGHVDFVRGGADSPRGRSIVALPSAAKGGSLSRVVPRLSGGTVTSLRTDIDVIATEYGVAELRGCSLESRMRHMIELAHPDHREALERSAWHLAKHGTDVG